MEALPQKLRLVKRAYWLVNIRWIAVLGVVSATFTASRFLGIAVHSFALYGVALILAVYNAIFLVILNHSIKPNGDRLFGIVKGTISAQISLDLLLLTVLLHFSGGIENPFVIFFVFHMVIVSILLSQKEGFLQATLAVSLLIFLALLEYKGLIKHYCLEEFMVRDMHNNGSYVVASVSVIALTLYLVVYLTSSIAKRLRAQEEAYWQTSVMLEQKDRIKDEYVSRVTHDIKGHLAAIQSCLDVVINDFVGSLNPQQEEFVGRAHKRTKTVATFVRTLLRLTQMRLTSTLEKEYFSLKYVIENAFNTIQRRAKDKNITTTQYIEDSADRLYGNQFSIEEMLTNLLLNAIKYTPENGSVALNAKVHDDDYVIIEITDTGIGIPEEEIPRVFDEFFRASNAKKIERDGTGLGLSIARQIIERHAGKIWVENNPSVGTTFCLTLARNV